MKKILLFIIFTCISFVFIFTTCKKDEEKRDDALAERTLRLFFPLEKDISFGEQFDKTLDSNKSEYPVLDSIQYREAYNHLREMRDNILTSDDIKYKDEFPWQIKIINDDINGFRILILIYND